MACNLTTPNQCDACYNFREGEISARGLSIISADTVQHCKSYLNLTIAYCKFYSGLTRIGDLDKNINTCQICGKEF